jgi:NAD(P) transhydrogenase subunit beta
MAIAFIVTIVNLDQNNLINWLLIISGISIGGLIGTYLSKRVAMTDMPQMVAALNSMGGMSAVLVAWAAFLSPGSFGLLINGFINTSSIIQMLLGILVGAITFSGSVIAFLKLQGLMTGSPIILAFRHIINILIFITIIGLSSSMVLDTTGPHIFLFLLVTILSLLLGLLLIIPIGGADMPVVISMLNSYSGFAAAIIGFTLGNMALVITGALVGSSGAILSYIMCSAMNRSFFSVIMGGFGDEATSTQSNENRPVKIGIP